MSHLGSLLVSLCADSQQPSEKEVGDLQLGEDLWQRSDGAQHLTDHTIRSAQCRVDLGAHTCTEPAFTFSLNILVLFSSGVNDSRIKHVSMVVPIRPPGAAYCRSLCSANKDTILEKMGLHISFPSWSLDTIPGRTSIS